MPLGRSRWHVLDILRPPDPEKWTRPQHWQTVYGLSRRRQRAGTWTRIREQLQVKADSDGLITWEVPADSAIARGHQHAAGARKGELQKEPGPGSRPDETCADRAYGPRPNRAYLRRRGIGCTLREKRDQIATHRKRPRAVATRYDKLAVRYEATAPEAPIIATG